VVLDSLAGCRDDHNFELAELTIIPFKDRAAPVSRGGWVVATTGQFAVVRKGDEISLFPGPRKACPPGMRALQGAEGLLHRPALCRLTVCLRG